MKYADSGVNIDAATRALARAKEAVRSTWDARVKNELGAFGGLFQAAPGEPLLVASRSTASAPRSWWPASAGRYDTVGEDLVNHCVDDILVQGAEPLFFLDYFATGSLDEDVLPAVLEGFAAAAAPTAAPCWAARPPRCPGSTRRASSTWPAPSSGGCCPST